MHILITIIIFLIVLAVLVIAHEFGHFIVARLFGVKVLRFSVGFGKVFFRLYDRSGTEYAFSAVPLGGYVKMLDEEAEEVPKDQIKYAFNRQHPLKRMLIVIAGPTFNFLLAVLVLWLMFMVGVQGIVPVVGQVTKASIAAQAGMRGGQKIITVDGYSVNTWQDVTRRMVYHLGSRSSVRIQTKNLKHGYFINHTLQLAAWHVEPRSSDVLGELGLKPRTLIIPPIIGSVLPGDAADQAGIKAGDRILTINNQTIQDFEGAARIIESEPNKPVQLGVLRGSKRLSIKVVPKQILAKDGRKIGVLGVYSVELKLPVDWVYKRRYQPAKAFWLALKRVGEMTKVSVALMIRLIKGHLSWKYIGGPISIGKGAGLSLQYGLAVFLEFVALISISLGIINLFPIPVLDGGYLVYYTAEFIRRRPIPIRLRLLGIRLGMYLLFCLVLFTIINDLFYLFV